MLAPSNVIQLGVPPTMKVPRAAPSAARSLVTLPLWLFAIHILAPSNAAPAGCWPTLNSAAVWLIAYQRSIETDSGVAYCPHTAGEIALAATKTASNFDLFMEFSYNSLIPRRTKVARVYTG